MDQNRARAACKEKIGGCTWERWPWGCYGGVRDCRGGLIGVSVSGSRCSVFASQVDVVLKIRPPHAPKVPDTGSAGLQNA